MSLPAEDRAYLEGRGQTYEVVPEANMICVVLPGFPLPPGYDRRESDLLLRLSPGYPDVPPDMWWFGPAVNLTNGQPIPATNCVEQHLGRSWQRWSRHFNGGQWKSGVDSLESFVALIRQELRRYTGNHS
ncbi:MAG: hypothetical protein HYU53_04250 [Acidobacteria bacterium]|nr:hypothetical protein [Acidobacteriota bacterium]